MKAKEDLIAFFIAKKISFESQGNDLLFTYKGRNLVTPINKPDSAKSFEIKIPLTYEDEVFTYASVETIKNKESNSVILYCTEMVDNNGDRSLSEENLQIVLDKIVITDYVTKATRIKNTTVEIFNDLKSEDYKAYGQLFKDVVANCVGTISAGFDLLQNALSDTTNNIVTKKNE